MIVKQERGDDSDKKNEEGNLAAGKELGDTPKSKPRVSKRQKQNEFQKQVINLLDQEDDDIDLYFQSLAKKLKRTLTEGEIDNVMDEINGVVSRHVRQARIRQEGRGWIYAALPTRSTSVSAGPGISAIGSTSSARCQHLPSTNAHTAAVQL